MNRFLSWFRPSVRPVRALIAAVLLGVSLITSGCVAIAAAGAGAAGVVWVRGALETHVERDLARVHQASLASLKDLEFVLVGDRKSSLDAELTARTALDKKVTVTLKQVTPNTTKITVRVGIFGDEAMSNMIMVRIREKL